MKGKPWDQTPEKKPFRNTTFTISSHHMYLTSYCSVPAYTSLSHDVSKSKGVLELNGNGRYFNLNQNAMYPSIMV